MHPEHAGNAVSPGRAGPDRNQRVHVGIALFGQRPGLAENAVAAAEQDGRGEREFHDAQRWRAVHRHARKHDRHGQQRGLDKALFGLFDPCFFSLNQQAALGKRIHRPGFIAEATDDTEHAVTVDHAMHGGGRRGKIDGD